MSLTQYLLEFSICLALFYSLYHFLLRKETFFQLNRWYLLLTPVMAMAIPFLNMELPKEAVQSSWDRVLYPLVSNVQESQVVFWQIVEAPTKSGWSFTYLDLLLTVYLLGVFWMAGRLFYRTWRLLRLIGQGKQEAKQGYIVVNANEALPASSFLSYIFWEDGPLSPERKSILEHELVHVRQWHSLDVILMEIWVLLKWFHPFIYWYRKSLRLTHEYIADAYVSSTSESRLAYATLLANCKQQPTSNKLLHHFHSSIKMRLIMLAKKQSNTWNFLKLAAIVPVTAVLLLLFSFNLAEDLPDTLIDPLSRVENSFNNFARQSVLPKTIAAPVVDLKKSYKIKWGEIECNCQPEQFPNLYHCENQSMLPKELRRLIRKEGGFQLLLEDQPQGVQELKALSKFAKDMGDYPSQLVEMGQRFKADSPFWKKAEKGDVFNFSFTNGQGDYFEFDVVINNRKEEFVFGSKVELGDLKFNINLLNDAGLVYLDAEELKDKLQTPLKVRKNNESYYQLAKARITNRAALRQDEWKRINGDGLDISQSKAILEVFPGDRINVELISSDEEKIKFDIWVRKNSAWDGRKREQAIYWGNRTFKPNQSIVLTKAELRTLIDEKIYLFANGKKHLMNSDALELRTSSRQAIQKGEVKYVTGISGFLKDAEDKYKAGDQVVIEGLEPSAGYMAPRFILFIDVDWREIFVDKPEATLSDNGDTFTIPKATPADLDRILSIENFIHFFYEFEVDGEKYPGYEYNKMSLKKLVENGLPKKKLVLRRVNTFGRNNFIGRSKKKNNK